MGETKALKRKRPQTQKFAIQKTSFRHLVNEIIGPDMHIASNALDTLRVVAEQEMVNFFEDAQIVASLNKRKTVNEVDVKVVKALRATKFLERKRILEN